MQSASLGKPCADFFEDIFFGRDDKLSAPFLACIAVLPETVVLECARREEAAFQCRDETVTDALVERFAGGRHLWSRRRFGNESAGALTNVDMAELLTA